MQVYKFKGTNLMKSFNEFLFERNMNGEIYMTIGRAFMSLDRALNFSKNQNLAGVGQILDQELESLNRVQGAYAQNMDPQSTGRIGYGAENATRQLGEVFRKFYEVFSNLRKQLQNPSADLVNLITQAKNDLANDYQSATSLIVA